MVSKFLQKFQATFCVLAKSYPTTHVGLLTFSGDHKLSTCSTFSTGKALVEGVHLNWEKFGNGPHAVLCLPGLVGSVSINFLPVIKKMNLDKYTFIGVDPAGYGKSRPPDRNVSTKEFCLAKDGRLAGMVMKELGYDRFSVLGWSNGGITAAHLASASPANVQKLVMVNAPFRNNARGALIALNLSTWKESQLKPLLEVYEKPYLEKMLLEWKQFIDKTNGSDEFKNFCLNKLHKISAPTLYIRGMKDIIVLLEEAKDYGKQIGNFKLHNVLHGGHDHFDFLDELVSATDNFLSL